MAFYHDQHLAWQQRVSKEISTASKFCSQYQPIVKFSPLASSGLKKTVSGSSTQKFYQTSYSRNPGVYAEVRGKYSRPAPLLQKAEEYSFLAPKEINLISRPSTSGSLKPRCASVKNISYAEVNGEELDSSVKPRIFKYKSIHRKPEELKEKSQPRFAEKMGQHGIEKLKDQEIKQEKTGKDEGKEERRKKERVELEKIKNNQDELLKGGVSYASGLTTSTKKRYILELETLLREEKLKRIRLEETLKKVAQ